MDSSFEIDSVRIPFRSPFTTSLETEDARNALILRYTSGGITALSECVTSNTPFYGYEDNTTAKHIIIDFLAPVLRGEPSPSRFVRKVERIRGHEMAKAAVEMLLWDFHSKKTRTSIVSALGPTKGYADVGISIGMNKLEKMVQDVGDAIERGYKRFKVKIEKGKEQAILRAIRDAYPTIPLSADANSCYSYKDLEILKRIDKFDLLYIEQPLGYDDLVDHARLAKQISTPICLDESITSPDKARQAFEIGATQIINIKPGRLGGLTNSLEVAKIAKDNGGHTWVGGMLETGVGRAFNVAFASLELVDFPGDTSPNDKYFARDIVKNPFTMTEGRIRPNSGPGIGVQLDETAFREYTVERTKVF